MIQCESFSNFNINSNLNEINQTNFCTNHNLQFLFHKSWNLLKMTNFHYSRGINNFFMIFCWHSSVGDYRCEIWSNFNERLSRKQIFFTYILKSMFKGTLSMPTCANALSVGTRNTFCSSEMSSGNFNQLNWRIFRKPSYLSVYRARLCWRTSQCVRWEIGTRGKALGKIQRIKFFIGANM